MSVKCEFCGRYFPEGEGWFGYFRKESHPKDRFTVYTLYFCCRGHLDSFLNVTTMTEVNSEGLTVEEQNRENQWEYVKTHPPCTQCGNEFYISHGLKCEELLFVHKNV